MRHIIAALFVAVLLTAGGSAWAGFVKGPYIQSVTKSDVVFMWESSTAAPGTLVWGEDEVLSGGTLKSVPGTMHEVGLEGLKPNTTYYYQVTVGGENSPVYRFRTAPDAYTPFRFVAYGDTRSGYDDHRRVVAAILSEKPDIVTNSGDLVCTGGNETCWQQHFDITRELMATTPYFPAIGNHETEGLDITQYKRYFSLPPNGEPAHHKNYYHVDWGNVRIITLDDTVIGLTPGSIHYEWLIGVLQEAADSPYIQHIFIHVHAGPFTAKPGRDGAPNLRNLMDTFAHYGVRAILSGHDHHYYRGKSQNGVNFIVTGGGGAPIYDCVPRLDFGVENGPCVMAYHYVVMDINAERVQGVVKSADGKVIDEFEWRSTKKLPPKPDDTDPPDVDAPDGEVPVADGDFPVADGEDVPPNGDSPLFDGDAPEDGESVPNAPAGDGNKPSEHEPKFGFAGCRSITLACGASLLGFALILGFIVWRRRNGRV